MMQPLSTPFYKVPQIYDDHYVSVWHAVVRRANFFAMRLLDFVVVVASLPILLLLCGVIAVLIKLDSPGPAFFIQERVGARPRFKDGQLVWEVQIFRMFKFRSMFHNADQSLHQEHIKHFVQGTLELAEEGQARAKLVDDPRITPIGHFLRKTSLDELPQVLNVLKGEMSLVGPRPVPFYEVAEYQERHYARLAAFPGLTGLWQLEGRGEVTFEEMMRLDIKYVRQQSLWLNLKILILTLPSVLAGHGAA